MEQQRRRRTLGGTSLHPVAIWPWDQPRARQCGPGAQERRVQVWVSSPPDTFLEGQYRHRRRRFPRQQVRRSPTRPILPLLDRSLAQPEKTALHEAGHAVAWHASGGKVKRIEIWRAGRAWRGLCTYKAGSRLSVAETHSLARAAFAGPLACDVAGDPDAFEWPDDYEAAIEVLKPLYADRTKLHAAAGACWKSAAELMSSPAGFRSALALAARLVHQRTLIGFPSDCHIAAQRCDPRLREAAARLRADFDRVMAEDLTYAITWSMEAEAV